MSMSEFDEQFNAGRIEHISLPTEDKTLPADFSPEELTFAKDLQVLFSSEQEELPPYFVQTLLEPEDERFAPAAPVLVQKTTVRVFGKLHLRRRIFQRSTVPVLAGLSGMYPRRSLLAVGAFLMLFILVTVAFTGQSFAIGMTLLLQGGRGGVYPVTHYPQHIPPPTLAGKIIAQPEHLDLTSTQQVLHFPLYLPTAVPNNYLLTRMYLYRGLKQLWADGPILELQYDIAPSGKAPAGTGQIYVREFKPKGDVLQLVQAGSTHAIQINQNGRAKAIYVDGQWISHAHSYPIWSYGGRSELIYQQGDVVFWIVGDQRDGIKESQLLTIANSLQAVNLGRVTHLLGDSANVTRIVRDLPGPFTSDVIMIFPDDNTDGPYLRYVDSGQGNPEKPGQKNMLP